MSKVFTIPKKAYEPLGQLLDLGSDKLQGLVKVVEGLQPTLDLDPVIDRLAKVAGLGREKLGGILFGILLPLAGIRPSFSPDPAAFLEQFASTLHSENKKWYDDHSAALQACGPQLERLLAPDTFFALVHKAHLLFVNRPVQAREFEVLTELRPVYNEAGTELRAVVLTNTLVVEYEERETVRTLHLTLDQADLRALREQIERAETKIETLVKQPAAVGVPVLLPPMEG